jgi:hypothetical protein
MSNIFKSVSNSRFDVLNVKEDKKEDKKRGGIKSEPLIKGNHEPIRPIMKNNSFAKYDTEHKDNKKYISFDDKTFPELVSIKNKQSNTNVESNVDSNKISFTDILKVEKEIKDNAIENQDKLNQYNYKKEEEEEEVDPKIVFKKLADMYEKWKREYIENWGMDEYEHYYRFPNYDYEYFDRLDALEEDNDSEVSMDSYDEFY